MIGTLQRLHCGVGAGYPFPSHVAALLNLVDAGQLLYGMEFPFGGVPGMETTMQQFQRTPLLNGQELRSVLRGDAVGLFPRLGATGKKPCPRWPSRQLPANSTARGNTDVF